MKPRLTHPRPTLLALAIVASFAAPSTFGATLTVDPTAPDAPMASDGKCSLREAVMSINAGTNQVDCVADTLEPYGSNDTLLLAPGIYTLSVPGLDEGFTDRAGGTAAPTVTNTPNAAIGDLDILKSLRILGSGVDSTLIRWDSALGTGRDRIFHVYATSGTVNVSIEDLTLSQGQTTEQPIKLGPASSAGMLPTTYYLRRAGGAIAVGPAAAVVLVDPNITGQANSEGRGGSKKPGTTGDEGGATLGLSLTNVTISGNSAQGDGGGLYTAAPLSATGLTVNGNSSTTNGGGIYNEGNTTLLSSSIGNNAAEGGGGFFGTGSNTVDFRGVTIHGNKAVGGGGISGRAGVTLRLLNSTLSGNIGSDTGGGLYTNGVADLRFVTLADNLAGADSSTAGAGINTFPSSAGGVTLKNVLMAGNRKGYVDGMSASDISALVLANCGSTGTSPNITSGGHNLSSDTSCAAVLTQTGDLNNKDPLIAALAANGGFGLTHALAAGSPALGAGQALADVSTDQRGTARDATPDIGAFELATDGGGATGTTDTVTGSSGGGCTTNPNAGFDPGLPALLLAALGSLFWRRRRPD